MIERVAKGDRLIDIGSDLGITPSSISKYLSKDEDYLVARRVGLEVRMEGREKQLEEAKDQVEVAKSRELLSHARWRAEREDPERWGQTNKLQVEHVDDLGERLRRSKERIVNPESDQQDQSRQSRLDRPSEGN